MIQSGHLSRTLAEHLFHIVDQTYAKSHNMTHALDQGTRSFKSIIVLQVYEYL